MYAPQFQINSRTFRLLEDIAQVRERIRSSLIRVPWVPSLVKDAMARAAWGSTAIEGCTLSLKAIRNLLEGKKAAGYPEQHVLMAKNYLNALTWLQNKETIKKINEKELLQLHKRIGEKAVDEGPVGAYRKIDVRAGLHVGAPWKKIPGLVNDLLKWLNGPAKEIPSVFSSAILHFRLVEIHPFRDGNGRVARAMATWELYRKGFDTLHIFALDEILLEGRIHYIKNLQRVQVEGHDLGEWIEFIAEAVLETLERVNKRIQSFSPTLKEPISLTVKQEKLLHLLGEKGGVGIQELAQFLKLTNPGVHYLLKPLIQSGVIVRHGAHKKTKYLLAAVA